MSTAEIEELLLERVNLLRGEPGAPVTEAYKNALKDFGRFVIDRTLPDR
jgi:hypothetical protein